MNVDEQRARAAALRELHHGPNILVLPNAWDCASARLFEQAGFPAVATTSGGIAATLGYPDGQRIRPGEMLLIAGRIAESVSVPVTADLEAGYGRTIAEVVEFFRQAIAAGVVGANLEDGRGAGRPLVEINYQTDLIKALREIAATAGVRWCSTRAWMFSCMALATRRPASRKPSNARAPIARLARTAFSPLA